ncbi:HHR169Wp [Eremothecium sinecaudum]|uniref:HHR169Wp n=1 Tax=Eremothecium sinecaudum TaxID=45286 RepID=A0A120K2X6_9SACH|nr:HHR169Wp [Eremothecium sinecaudum]AMD22938.1 HHR169Wp [Eremothecium sinecaudum]
MLRLGKVCKVIPRRFLNINTLSTPNENALKFISTDGELLQEKGAPSVEIKNTQINLIPYVPLASRIFSQCPMVESLMIGNDFITINKDELVNWNQVTPTVMDILTQHLASGAATVLPEFYDAQVEDNKHSMPAPTFEYDEDEQEISEMIEELIKTRIRPAIMEDGGDILYRGWNPETGIVYLKLQGACKSCSSSEVTLKHGIESMLKHYIEEVQGVEQVIDPEEQVALEEFKKLEERIQNKSRKQE